MPLPGIENDGAKRFHHSSFVTRHSSLVLLGLRAMASLVLVAGYLRLYSKMKKSVAADKFICY